jgi:outer membrane protein W
MKSTNHFRITRLNVALLALALAVPAASVGAGDNGWQVKVGGVWIHPNLNYSSVEPEGEHLTAASDNAIGLGLGLEYRLSDRIGIELGVLRASPNLHLQVQVPTGWVLSAEDHLSFTPITAGFAVHLTPGKPVDLYVAPALAYVMYGDLHFAAFGLQTETADLAVGNQWTWGLSLGADVRLGDGPWRINSAVSYIRTTLHATDIENGDPRKVDFNPFTVTLGIGYRF